MEWSWKARLGPLTMRLEHGVTAHLRGSTTWLRIEAPGVLALGYAPVARMALNRLVAAPTGPPTGPPTGSQTP